MHVDVRAYVEWCESKIGDREHLTAYLVFEVGGERSENVMVDEDVTGHTKFSYGLWLDRAMEVMRRRLDGWLIKCAEDSFLHASDEAIRDDDRIPPRNPSDWSHAKLYNILDKAFHAVTTFHPNRDPTLAHLAAHISRMYRMNEPLTGEGLRKLLKRHGVDWRETKREWKERLERLKKRKKTG